MRKNCVEEKLLWNKCPISVLVEQMEVEQMDGGTYVWVEQMGGGTNDGGTNGGGTNGRWN
jgi:hypothetical protein